MKGLATFLIGVIACVSAASAQISVGPSGSGLITFDTAPAASEWTSRTYGTDSGGVGIVNAAQLDQQVQLVSANDVTNALGSSTVVPPSQNNYARWNSSARYLQSKIGNVECTVLMAKLTNNTGAALGCLGIRYEMGGGSFFYPESVPAFRGYYSLTGNAGSWVLIPGLCVETTGTVSTVVSFSTNGVWPHGSALFLLWADDNGPNSDPYYTIDDLEFTVAPRLATYSSAYGSPEVSPPSLRAFCSSSI